MHFFMLLLLSYVFKKCSIVSKWKAKALFSHVRLFASPRTVSHQPPQSIEFTRQRILEWVTVPFSRIFPAQGSNSGLPYCEQIFYYLSHEGSSLYLKQILKDCGRWREVNRSARDLKTQRITCSEFLDFLFAFHISDWLPGK